MQRFGGSFNKITLLALT